VNRAAPAFTPEDVTSSDAKGARIRRQRSNGDSQRLTPISPTGVIQPDARQYVLDVRPSSASHAWRPHVLHEVSLRVAGDVAHNPPKRLDGHLAVVATQ